MPPNRLHLRRTSALLNPLAQFVAAAAGCVALPFAIVTELSPHGWYDHVAKGTALFCLAALLVGFLLHRSLSKLPGTYESHGILPAYLTSYGAALVVILLSRIEYARSLLLVSFVATIVWFFLVYLAVQRRRVLRLKVISGGHTKELETIEGVTASRLKLGEWPQDVDAVVADFRYEHSDEWEARIADYTLAGIPVYHSKDLLESLTGRTELENLSENTFGSLGPAQSWMLPKLIVDWIAALVLFVLLLPVMLVAALAIRLDSRGPVLFRQSRVGFRGAQFKVYKFRTMFDRRQAQGEDRLAELVTTGNDKRITRVGRFLRFTRIDELPQLYNVLRGEMSLIGPRPEAEELSDFYRAEVPFYRYRHIVRPGITGWAQVNQGHVADVEDIKRKLQYDFYYIRNFSIWLDVLIVMKTIKTVMTGFGHK